jgi:hypothetical protein
MLTVEKAIDIIPYLVEISEKVGIADFKKMINIDDKEETGIKMFLNMGKNIKKCRIEIYHVLALVEEKSINEVSQMNIFKVMKTFKEIFKDEELKVFFSELEK